MSGFEITPTLARAWSPKLLAMAKPPDGLRRVPPHTRAGPSSSDCYMWFILFIESSEKMRKQKRENKRQGGVGTYINSFVQHQLTD
jgi:hypothetical protein